ncbi:MAG: CHASE2 domain-containing protein, partial [Marinomonas sp.]
MSKSRLFAEWFALLLAAVTFVVLAGDRGWGERLDLNLLDFASSINAGEGSKDIVIVEIDDPSLAQVGNWPWDRTRHAELIDRLAELGPAAVAIDILFLEATEPVADEALASSIRNAGNVIVPHTFFDRTDGVDGSVAALPVPSIAAAASGLGHVSIFPERDGIVRRFSPIYQSSDGKYEHLILGLSKVAGRDMAQDIAQADALPIIQYQLPGGFLTFSASDVMDRAAPQEFFKDKIVLIGATAQGLGDRYAVPTYAGRIMSGVEVQANALDSVISGRTLASLSPWVITAFHLAAIASLFLVYWLRPPAEALRYSLLLITALVVLALASVILLRTWLPIAPALAAILIAYPLWGWRRLSTVSRFLD